MIAESRAIRIRCMSPASEQWKSDLNYLLACALIESGSLPLQPLVSIIFGYATGDSTTPPHHRLPASASSSSVV